jgi:asparagine synthase (glutamine-hydrolysing)
MCGICGEFSFNGGAPVDARVVSAMAATLRHRGPDHAASYVSSDASAALGFRRLSIIDLRAAAHQPLGNEDGAVQMVFNGEIYNYRELRSTLVANGHTFRSNSDSEVIVHLYEEHGDRAIDRLDGMFAVALWDNRTRTLLLARDRAGKKPLFVWTDGQRVAFASEIKALLAHPAVDASIDEDAIPYYFLHGYVPHPQTFYRAVFQVEPGTVLSFDGAGRRACRRYWQLTFPAAATDRREAPSRQQAAAEVRSLVTAAVERRLMSDVPLGAFLSGGLDSTIVVGVMSQLLREPVRTFSIGFDEDAAFDETSMARDTARRFNTEHTEFRVRPSAIELIDTLVYHHDGPFADSSAIPTYVVSKLTREHVTVALTGDGGDEVFAGYLRFAAALAAERVPSWAGDLAGGALEHLPTPGNERHWIARARRFARFMQFPLEERLAAWAGVFYDDVEDLLDRELLTRVRPIDRRRHLSGVHADGTSPLSRVLAANFHSYLHDDLLVKIDRMSMATSLEARAPFLDRELIEYVATLPDEFKLDGRRTKVILREAFADLVPDAVNRGAKKGFGVPLDTWLRNDLRDYARDVLLSPNARLHTYVSRPYVARLLDEQISGRANHGHRLWSLLTFERWLQVLPSWRTDMIERRN